MDTTSTEAHSFCVVNLFSADLFLLGQNSYSYSAMKIQGDQRR